MGLAAIIVAAIAALLIASFVAYGMVLGMARLFGVPRKVYRWLESASAELYEEEEPALADSAHCWDFKHCAPSVRERCASHRTPDETCWLAKLRQTGKLSSECLGCSRFSLSDYVAGPRQPNKGGRK